MRGPTAAESNQGVLADAQEIFTELRWEPIELTDLGDVVVAETRLVARGRGSDLPVESDETDVFWFRDGQIERVQGFPD